jgi:tRNA pseudouridine55 synthase
MEDFYKNYSLHDGCKLDDFNEGRVLLFDKPMGWSSFDLVNKVRYLIRQQTGFKKIKVGHAGTLDPLATGLLIVCTGKLTKQIDTLMGMDKEYVAAITMGSTTPSYDLETEPDKHFATDHISAASIEATLKSFNGIQMQTPPLFSAIKINGKRAYEHARKGHDMELSQREVNL